MAAVWRARGEGWGGGEEEGGEETSHPRPPSVRGSVSHAVAGVPGTERKKERDVRGSTTQAVLARGWISSEHVVRAGRAGVGTRVRYLRSGGTHEEKSARMTRSKGMFLN